MRANIANPELFTEIFQRVTGTTPKTSIRGVSTDSRSCVPGDLFIAIQGQRVDGHLFLNDLSNNGCKNALVSRMIEKVNGINQIVVNNPVKTIGKIARELRLRFSIPIIAITGSNGKTTTKDLLSHILNRDYNPHVTHGNFNTSVGLPLTLLELTDIHTISILELGANQPGDIRYLCWLCQPTHGLITNIAPAHLEGFGSIEEIAREKAELFKALAEGVGFINLSDEKIRDLEAPENNITYGIIPDCDFPGDYHHEPDGKISLTVAAEEIRTNSRNIIFAKNLHAAITVARTMRVSWDTIQSQVLSFVPPPGRSVVKHFDNITVIDDTYNANYKSVVAAIEFLKGYAGNGRRLFIFGDMYELGDDTIEYHIKVGEKCNSAKLDIIYSVGSETVNTDSTISDSILHKHFDNKTSLGIQLQKILQEKDVVLFKGSRSMEMETIIREVFES
ncbi:MAG: UDP-N-acetylmuramoyl-tripeptide--D-alanyl-D-alanine ligase [Candidatus Neomarinimicrobiota bacterium]